MQANLGGKWTFGPFPFWVRNQMERTKETLGTFLKISDWFRKKTEYKTYCSHMNSLWVFWQLSRQSMHLAFSSSRSKEKLDCIQFYSLRVHLSVMSSLRWNPWLHVSQ